jgi:hypothetical protein
VSPAKGAEGLLLLHHEHVPSPWVKLMAIAHTSSSSHCILHHLLKTFHGIERLASVIR